MGGASESVLDAIARALQLDEDERAHLYDLARGVAPGSRRKRPERTSPGVTELIGELSTRSTDFRARWAKHHVRRHSRGRKVVNHPAVGRMDLAYDDFALPGDPHVSITTYTADPGTPSADGLTLLATWAETQKQPQTVNDEARRRIRPRHP
ncbi:MAG: hypothetical protein HOY79_05795 [Streptomyces sp.]|nr:hypothetical protein [Streptomyces sp.]